MISPVLAALSAFPSGGMSALLMQSIDLGKYGPKEVGEAVIEIGLLWAFFYVVLKFLHGTRGLAIMKGVMLGVVAIVLALVFVGATFEMTFSRLQVAGVHLLQILALVLIVLFQPELRRGFTRLSEAGGRAGKGDGKLGRMGDVVDAFFRLSSQQTGALVVFEQQVGIQGLLDSGVPIDAAASGTLIESIFFPKSPLHDGSVIIREGRIVAASCMLPLTDDPSVSRQLGTRHRAAIGVTEESDAVVVIVSEETGQITVVHRGELHPADDRAVLVKLLERFLQGFGAEGAS
ncbi:MAG: diadenylate cyclase CdaA [Planctomycetota bacterium]|nr:diadenylate cyclase CdaA [Planctomycetota bacterium]